MNTLSIEVNERNQYVAKMNGVQIPFVKSIEITSRPGEMTKVIIEVIVASTNGAQVVIKESKHTPCEF